MKALLTILLCMAWVINAAAYTYTPWNRISFNVKNATEEEDGLSRQMMEFRHACIKKAELGEQLALKKISGTPLSVVLNNIMESHNTHRHMPWYLVLEMQRLARDAYRQRYDNNDDIDQFVMDLYHSCLNHGW